MIFRDLPPQTRVLLCVAHSVNTSGESGVRAPGGRASSSMGDPPGFQPEWKEQEGQWATPGGLWGLVTDSEGAAVTRPQGGQSRSRQTPVYGHIIVGVSAPKRKTENHQSRPVMLQFTGRQALKNQETFSLKCIHCKKQSVLQCLWCASQ